MCKAALAFIAGRCTALLCHGDLPCFTSDGVAMTTCACVCLSTYLPAYLQKKDVEDGLMMSWPGGTLWNNLLVFKYSVLLAFKSTSLCRDGVCQAVFRAQPRGNLWPFQWDQLHEGGTWQNWAAAFYFYRRLPVQSQTMWWLIHVGEKSIFVCF